MRIRKLLSVVAGCLISVAMPNAIVNHNTVSFDLTQMISGDAWEFVNRKAELTRVGGTSVISFKGQPGNGHARLKKFAFQHGIIELELKGQNLRGRSFIGIAFRGKDRETYDAVYFRPFNFISRNSLQRSHGVQYVSHPENTWFKLRQTSPGKYENEVTPVPDPDDFFKARVVINQGMVQVYVNQANKPCLTVRELSDRRGGWIGLWMGNNSPGVFKSFKVTKFSD